MTVIMKWSYLLKRYCSLGKFIVQNFHVKNFIFLPLWVGVEFFNNLVNLLPLASLHTYNLPSLISYNHVHTDYKCYLDALASRMHSD